MTKTANLTFQTDEDGQILINSVLVGYDPEDEIDLPAAMVAGLYQILVNPEFKGIRGMIMSRIKTLAKELDFDFPDA